MYKVKSIANNLYLKVILGEGIDHFTKDKSDALSISDKSKLPSRFHNKEKYIIRKSA